MLGIVLGPGVLGNVFPGAYDAMFRIDRSALEAFDADTSARLEKLERVDATPTALEEMLLNRSYERAMIISATQASGDQYAAGLLRSLLLAVVMVMLLEALLSPRLDEQGQSIVSPAYRRLISVRYALIALMIALGLARPGLIVTLPWVMAVAVTVLALAVGLVPLGKRSAV